MDLKSIHEIFKDRILRIPSYQRGYSWRNNESSKQANPEENKDLKGQLIDLWNDLKNIPDGSWHYTGLLTLGEVKQKDYEWLPNYKQYAIVDGQQRITSILILIAVIIEKAEELGLILGIRKDDMKFQYLYIQKESIKAYIFGYDKDNPSDKFFRKHILGLNEIEDDSQESAYTESLKKAKIFYTDAINQFIGKDNDKSEKLQILFKKVTSDLRMNEYILPEELDEYVVFETMNNRGKPLSELEKLKNRLMYLNSKFGYSKTDEADRLVGAQKKRLENEINQAWITVYQSLGANKNELLDDEEFVKNHWIVYFDRYKRHEASVYANHLFNEYFTLEQVYGDQLTPENVKDYVKSLQDCSEIWNKIHNTHYFSSDEEEWKDAILGLHRVGFRASFKPLTLAIFSNASRDITYLKLLRLLEDYAFKLFHVADRQSNTGDSKLFSLAAQVYHGKISSHDAYNNVQSHMNYYYRFSLFENQIQELFEVDRQQGYYKWSGLHYFLFRFDCELRKKNQTTTQASMLNWEDFKNKDSIEHIYPQSAAKSYEDFSEGKDTPELHKDYDELQKDWVAFSNYSPEERKRFCNSLGNLLAISNSDNASFSNDRFIYKVDQSNKGSGYKKRGYRYDSMSAQIVSTEKDWTPETLKQRGIIMLDEMLRFLDEKEDLINYNEKLSLLGLEFLIDNNNSGGDNSD